MSSSSLSLSQPAVFESPLKAAKMMHLARRRREAERQRKLEGVFNSADVKGEGKLTVEQVVKIFASEEVTGEVN